jgi:hypothetical protein
LCSITGFRVNGPRHVVDVEAVRMHADGLDVGAELVEHMGGDLVGRAVRAVDHDFHPAQIERGGKGALAELDVAPGRVVDASRFSELRRFLAADFPAEALLDFRFDGIGQLAAVGRKELDAVVFVGVMRRADDHASLQPQGAREVGDRRSRQGPGEHHVHPGRGESRLERRLEHVSGDARVFPDQNGRVRAPGQRRALHQHLARREAQAHHEFRRDRRLAYPAAHPVSSEVLSAHVARFSRRMPRAPPARPVSQRRRGRARF